MDAEIEEHDVHPKTGEPIPGHYLRLEGDVVLGPYPSPDAAMAALFDLAEQTLAGIVRDQLGF